VAIVIELRRSAAEHRKRIPPDQTTALKGPDRVRIVPPAGPLGNARRSVFPFATFQEKPWMFLTICKVRFYM
jgi:hypothetical protein